MQTPLSKSMTSLLLLLALQVARAALSHGVCLHEDNSVRALTRNANKPAAQALKNAGAEIVEADLTDRASLDEALKGVRAVFSVQDFLEAGVDKELRMGFNLTDAAGAAGVSHIVYSGASTIDRNTSAPHLDSKWQIEQRIRSLEIPWTVFRPAAFMDNWTWDREAIEHDGVITLPLRTDTVYRQVAVADIAAMVVIALERPDIWIGQIAPLAGEVSTSIEIAGIFSRVMGREIRYEQMSWETCRKTQGEDLTLMYRYFDQFGMDGDPRYLKRWHIGFLTLEDFLRAEGWGKPASGA
ncbi:MAG: NmrA/HSCARG family protein [Chloroflexales bacterium]|nr:NmrA/HSCARG family protein [Chloroflexales bacterium]